MSKKQGRFWKQLLLIVSLAWSPALAYFIIVYTEKLRPPEGQGMDPGPLTPTSGLIYKWDRWAGSGLSFSIGKMGERA